MLHIDPTTGRLSGGWCEWTCSRHRLERAVHRLPDDRNRPVPRRDLGNDTHVDRCSSGHTAGLLLAAGGSLRHRPDRDRRPHWRLESVAGAAASSGSLQIRRRHGRDRRRLHDLPAAGRRWHRHVHHLGQPADARLQPQSATAVSFLLADLTTWVDPRQRAHRVRRRQPGLRARLPAVHTDSAAARLDAAARSPLAGADARPRGGHLHPDRVHDRAHLLLPHRVDAGRWRTTIAFGARAVDPAQLSGAGERQRSRPGSGTPRRDLLRAGALDDRRRPVGVVRQQGHVCCCSPPVRTRLR